MDFSLIPLFFFSFLSYLSAAFAGFGGIIVPITLGAHLYSIKWMVPILIPMTLLLNLYIITRYHRYIDRSILLKKILPLMLIGLVIGIAVFNFVQEDSLKRVFGIMVVLLSARELYFLRRKNTRIVPISKTKSIIYILSAGIIHGVFVSGGPLLVYVLNKMDLPKSVFRSTLAVVWLVLNMFLTTFYIMSNRMNLETIKISAMLIPPLIIGIIIGEYLHSRVSERPFRIFVFVLLMLSGLSIVVR